MTLLSNLGLAFLLGLVLGFVNSVPIGPITITIMDTTFRRGFMPGLLIGLGALTVDAGYCVIGVFGMAAVQEVMMGWMKYLSVPILGVLGGRLIYVGLRGQATTQLPRMTDENLGANFSTGFLILLANPMAMAFWVVVAGTLFAWQWISTDIMDKVSFIVGMVLGTFLWFFLLARIVDLTRASLTDDRIRRRSL
ncbi:MAG: LysE family transporter, partial [Bacteroidetes bacterium]|nr:LysE family transporter [Bacteroidota bacterium]